jgi:hypothetical protein
MPGQLFGDGQVDHTCADDRDIEWVPFHRRHLKAKGKKVQEKKALTGNRIVWCTEAGCPNGKEPSLLLLMRRNQE